MLSNGFDKSLHLKRKTSRVLAVYLVLIHGLVLIALVQPLAIALLIQAMLYAGLFASIAYHVVYFRRQSDGQYYWVWHSGGVWQHGLEGQVFRLLSARCIQTPWFVLVTLINIENQRRQILIVRDQVDADTFRRLRVRLKLHHDEAAASREEAV
jgi:hypothetical protein